MILDNIFAILVGSFIAVYSSYQVRYHYLDLPLDLYVEKEYELAETGKVTIFTDQERPHECTGKHFRPILERHFEEVPPNTQGKRSVEKR